MNIPTVRQCLALMDDFAMYDNIRAHSLVVARVASALLTGLEQSQKISAPLPPASLVIAGALLHDIAKTQCLQQECRHAEVGEEICRDLGFPEIGEIVRDHVILSDYSLERYRLGIFNARELVYYADKRVRHDDVVTLDSRLAYIIERYGEGDARREQMIIANFRRCQDLEACLFGFLDYSPQDLPHFLAANFLAGEE